jgi:hypothetical protein
MKTLMVAVALATVFAAPAFAQSVNAWGWKGGLAAPASAKSAYAAAPFNSRAGALPARRGALSARRGTLSGLTYARNCNISPASPSYRTNCN